MLQPHFLDPRQELAIMDLNPEVQITAALSVKMSFNQQHVKSRHCSRLNSAKGHTCTAWGQWAAPALDERRKQSSLKLSPCLCLLLTTFYFSDCPSLQPEKAAILMVLKEFCPSWSSVRWWEAGNPSDCIFWAATAGIIGQEADKWCVHCSNWISIYCLWCL